MRLPPITDTTPAALRAYLLAQSETLGLDAIGVTSLSSVNANAAAARLRTFLTEGRHGDMEWLADTVDRRADPNVLWPEARSAILIGHSYGPETNPLADLSNPQRAVISVYAQGRDYHDVLKSKIRQLASSFAQWSGADVKIFVDTAPLMEKPLAQQAGLGWQGKHTNLVSRAHGSWLFLGAILTTADVLQDDPEIDHCGSCKRCISSCPTQAFPAPYQLDARRCLAYLSIEYRGHIAEEFRHAMGNRVYGCDDCLAVCPWNKFAAASHEIKYKATENTAAPAIADLLELDDAAFRKMFAGTPVKRTGRDRVLRNTLIAAGNSKDRAHLPAVYRLLNDKSPLVRAMAIWAHGQLADAETHNTLRDRHAKRETDPAVAAEWHRTTTGVTS